MFSEERRGKGRRGMARGEHGPDWADGLTDRSRGIVRTVEGMGPLWDVCPFSAGGTVAGPEERVGMHGALSWMASMEIYRS